MNVALYIGLALLYGVYLGINQIVDLHGRVDIAPWKPMVWELSSVVVVFAMIPLIVRFERIVRIDSKPRWRVIASHLGAAVLFFRGACRRHARPCGKPPTPSPASATSSVNCRSGHFTSCKRIWSPT